MEVRLEKHYGKDVFVSVLAEAARKSGCLCVRTENGTTTMCRHLKANIAWEAEASRTGVGGLALEAPSREHARMALIERAPLELQRLGNGEGPFADDGVCRLALVNYAVCLTGNLAMAVTRCPYYEAEDSPRTPTT